MPSPGFWATVREALRGSKEELTAIPIRRAVLLLAVPMVLEMSMESLFAIVDIFFVARLGADAVATVGLTESMIAIVYSLAMGLSAGATALVARRTGEKNFEGAARAAGQVIGVAIGASLAVGIIGLLLSSHLLAWMGASASVVALGSGYTAIMLGGSVTIFLLFVINAIFRAAGDAAIAMRTLWFSNSLNIVLAPCLIFGLGPFPRMGVEGAAIATTLSRGVGVAFQVVMLARSRGRLDLHLRYLRPVAREVADLARISAAASVQILVETASWLGLVRILSRYGSISLAGYTIAMRIALFVLLPPWGLANAAATLVGQNLGAGEPDRAERSVNTIAIYNVLFLGSMSVLFIVLPTPIVGLFTTDPRSVAEGATCLRLVSVGFICFAYGMVMIQAFNGAGDTFTPVAINVCSFWLLKLPLAYVLATQTSLGSRGVYLAITAAYSAQAIIATILFRRGRWKTKRLAPA